MPTLTGSIEGVTGVPLALAELRQVTVRAPYRRASLAEQSRLVASVPVPVSVTAAGEITVDLEPGPAVLVVDTDRSHDVYELAVTADMTLLTEALAQAAPERSWAESVMIQLRKEAVTAAAVAVEAKARAILEHEHVHLDAAHVDAVAAQLPVLLDQANVFAQDQVPPYLQDAELKRTYVPQSTLPTLATKAELAAKGGGTPATPGVELLAGKLAFGGAGQHHVGVVADSTFNDHREAPWVWWMQYGDLFPASVRRIYNYWNTATGVWNRNINAVGTGTAANDGLVLTDTFTRTVADVVGTAPDFGPVWQGNAGVWSANGSLAAASAAGDLNVNAGVRDTTLKVDLSIATASALNQTHRYYIGATSAPASDGVWALVSANSTGVISLRLYTTLGGTSTAVGTAISGGTIGVPSGASSPVTLSVEVKINIQNISATFTGPTGSQTLTGTITEAQYAGLGTWVGIKSLNAPSPGLKIDRVEVGIPPTPASGDTIEMWNGAWAGAKITSFTPAVRAQRFGDKHIDVLILSMGHNNGTQTPAAFVAEIEAWVEAWMVEHPETVSVMWVSQNPQFPPAAGGAAHRDRQAAMRVAARKNGWDYIPAFEAFAALPDGGASLVQADGIHPTMPGSGIYTGNFGSVLTGEAIHRAVTDRL